jgi:hypothetical protein
LVIAFGVALALAYELMDAAATGVARVCGAGVIVIAVCILGALRSVNAPVIDAFVGGAGVPVIALGVGEAAAWDGVLIAGIGLQVAEGVMTSV